MTPIDDITLTAQEYEDLKDDIKFKTKVSINQKYILRKLDNLSGVKERLDIQGAILLLVIAVVIGVQFIQGG